MVGFDASVFYLNFSTVERGIFWELLKDIGIEEIGIGLRRGIDLVGKGYVLSTISRSICTVALLLEVGARDQSA